MAKNQNEEIVETIIETIGNEVKELLVENWAKIEEYIDESDSRSTNIGFNVNVNMKGKSTITKTRLTASQVLKDSKEDEIGDPEQPEFDEVDAVVPKKRVPKKRASKQAKVSAADE